MGEGDHGKLPNTLDYEELIAGEPETFDYPEIDDRAAAGLCYTSGTTGNPKGVLYSHRSQILHSFGTCLADAMGLQEADRVLPIVPMFHANSWGIPYAAGLIGCDLIMPSQFLQAEPLAKLLEEERVTVSAAVPTIWMDLLRHADTNDVDLSALRTVICAGAAVPLSLMQPSEERDGVHIVPAWAMPEMRSLGTVARPPAD